MNPASLQNQLRELREQVALLQEALEQSRRENILLRQKLDALARRIRNLPEVTLTLALTDVLAQLERAERDLAAPTLPEDEAATTALFDLLESAEDTDDERRFATEDFRLVRLHVRLRAVGTHRAQEIVARIDEAAEGALGGNYTVLPTGAFRRVIVDSNRLNPARSGIFAGTAAAQAANNPR